MRTSRKHPLFHTASGASHSPGCPQGIPAKSHFGKPARRAPLYLSFRGTEGCAKTLCQPEPGSQAGRGLCNVMSASRVHSGRRHCRSGPAAKAHFPGSSPLHETTYLYSRPGSRASLSVLSRMPPMVLGSPLSISHRAWAGVVRGPKRPPPLLCFNTPK